MLAAVVIAGEANKVGAAEGLLDRLDGNWLAGLGCLGEEGRSSVVHDEVQLVLEVALLDSLEGLLVRGRFGERKAVARPMNLPFVRLQAVDVLLRFTSKGATMKMAKSQTGAYLLHCDSNLLVTALFRTDTCSQYVLLFSQQLCHRTRMNHPVE